MGMRAGAETLSDVRWGTPTTRVEEEETSVVGRRSNDATKMTLTLPHVIAIAGAVLMIGLSIVGMQLRLQSNVDIILERMDADKRVAEINAKLTETNNAQLKEKLDKTTNRLDMQQIQIAEMQKQLALLTQGRK